MKIRFFLSLGFAILLLTLLIGMTFQSHPTMAADDVVKIGLSAPLTGDWAEYGNDFKRAVQMVIDRTNKMGGVHGKKIEFP